MRKINRILLDNKTQNKLNEWKEYNLKWVRETLKKMQRYEDWVLCCYCECELKDNSFHDIEHVKPKSKFKEETFNWNNLLLCCNKCNRSYKKDSYEEWFLNPSEEWYSFESNFDFNEECFYITKTNEAKITTDIVKLNDKYKHSFKSRLELMNYLQNNFEEYKKDNLSNDLIKKYIKRDFILKWELDSFWNWLLSKLINKLD